MKLEEDITRLPGITENSVEYFEEKGYNEVRDFEGVTSEELMDVKYMQSDRAEKIADAAEEEIEKMNDSDLLYDPTNEEYVEEEPENYTCECGAPFYDKSVFLAHWSLCSRD